MSSFPPRVRSLVEHFARNRDALRSPAYNEMQARREFIDPFFKALGWDMDNEQGLATARTTRNGTVAHRSTDTTDRQIDQFVYQLYGPTDGEIRIVEEATAK